jgi:hypothetical protein
VVVFCFNDKRKCNFITDLVGNQGIKRLKYLFSKIVRKKSHRNQIKYEIILKIVHLYNYYMNAVDKANISFFRYNTNIRISTEHVIKFIYNTKVKFIVYLQ